MSTHSMSVSSIPSKAIPSQTQGGGSEAVPAKPAAEAAAVSIEPACAWYFPVKAVCDVMAALLLLMLVWPVILLGAVLVKLTSRGPAFYRQTRLGRRRREFTVYKLRTMIDGAERDSGPVWAEPDDPRITPVGRVLRKMHIDELPQLVNVLFGQMSLIGPRPERPELIARKLWELPGYGDRLNVRPGITGLAQLQLPADTSMECVRRKLAYDRYYVRHVNPWLDLRIFWMTFVRVFADFFNGLAMLAELPDWQAVEPFQPPIVETAPPPRPSNGNGSGNGTHPAVKPNLQTEKLKE